MTTVPRIVLLSEPLLAARYPKESELRQVLEAARQVATGALVCSQASTAEALRDDVQKALVKHPRGAVLLIGGVETLPFFRLPGLDDDEETPSDYPFGAPGGWQLLEELLRAAPVHPVGRIPDHPLDTATSFAERISRLCSLPTLEPEAARAYALSSAIWLDVSRAIAAAMEFPPPVDSAPTRQPDDFTSRAPVAQATRQYYFNLHGQDRKTDWYGQIEPGGISTWRKAINPRAVQALAQAECVKGALVLSQACHGAYLKMYAGSFRPKGVPRSPEESICLKFLECGAEAFLGSTGLAYGKARDIVDTSPQAYGTPFGLEYSDILVLEFFKSAAAGWPLGHALLRARKALAATIRPPPTIKEVKTIIEFVLYGDPAGIWANAGAAISAWEEEEEVGVFSTHRGLSDWRKEPLTRQERSVVDAEGWQPYQRYVAPAWGARREIRVRPELQAGEVIVCFSERVEYADGTVREAQSKGGRALRSIQEELKGRQTWWQHGNTSPWRVRRRRALDALLLRRARARRANRSPEAFSPLLQNAWPPSQRWWVGLESVGLIGYGFSRRGWLGTSLAGAGILLGLWSVTKHEPERFIRVGAGRWALSFHQDITVNAPVNEVFAFWQSMQNLPRFMSHVEEVRMPTENLSHWKVRGPDDTHFEWDAVITRLVPHKVLKWKSVAGALVKNAGLVRFKDVGRERTRLSIRLSYNPPAGAIGHAFVRLMGTEPKRRLAGDLLCFKSLMERGRATSHGKGMHGEFKDAMLPAPPMP